MLFAQEKETVEEVEVVEVVEEDEVPENVSFSIIDEAPVYPGCKGDKLQLKKCLQYSIKKHVGRKFNSGLANELGLDPGRKKVYAIFKIDKEGNIVDVRARGPHARLEKEAIRVVKLLPKMIPGKQRGRPVGVRYNLPIILLVEKDEVIEEDEIIEVVEEEEEPENEDIPFEIIEDVPVFPGCEKLEKNLRKMCMQNQIKKHVAANFNVGLANELGLSSGKKNVYVIFKIDKNGDVVDLRARGPHKRLEMEAMRVVKLLPKMVPGKLQGKPVGVKYTLPITLLIEGNQKKE